MKRTLKHLKMIDLFKKQVQLYLGKEEGHRTYHGAITTLTIIILTFILLINNLNELYKRSNPQSIQSQAYVYNPKLWYLEPQNFTLQVAIQDSSFATYINESIFVMNPILVKKVVTKDLNNNSVDNYIRTKLPMIPCSEVNERQESLQSYFAGFDSKTTFCIDFNSIDHLEIQGNFDAPNYTYIAIDIYMCTNETKRSNGPECLDQQTIQQLTKNNYLSIQTSSASIDMNDFDNPSTPQGADLYTSISGQIYKEVTVYMQTVKTVTDIGLVMTNYIQEDVLIQQRYTEIMDLNQNSLMASVVIRMSTTETTNHRSYRKIQQIFGEVGGVWNVLFTFAMFLQMPLSILSYRLEIINSLFTFENSTKQITSMQNSEDVPCLTTTPHVLQSPKGNPSDPILHDNQQQERIRRLKSIISKKQQLKGLNEGDPLNLKDKLSKALTNSIKDYFNTVHNKISITYLHFITQYKFMKNKTQSHQFQYSAKKMQKSLDILYIIEKLQEVDKLKCILLNTSQLQVFDYLPKPKIKANPEQIDEFQYFSILKAQKTIYEKALEAQESFRQILQNREDPINRQLIRCMDQNIADLLQFTPNTDVQLIASPQTEQQLDISEEARIDYPNNNENDRDI